MELHDGSLAMKCIKTSKEVYVHYEKSRCSTREDTPQYISHWLYRVICLYNMAQLKQ